MSAALLGGYYIWSCLNAELFSILITLPLLILLLINIHFTSRHFMTSWEMIWICMYVFFVIGPLQNLRGNMFIDSSVSGFQFTDDILIKAMLLPTIFVAVLTYFSFREKEPVVIYNYTPNQFAILIWAAINIVSFFGTVVAISGFGNLLASRADKEDVGFSILLTVLPAFQISTFLMITIYWFRSKRDIWGSAMFIIVLIPMLMAQNPWNAPRNILVTVYFPFLFIFFNGRVKTWIIYAIFLFSAIVIMPISDLVGRGGETFSSAVVTALTNTTTGYQIPFLDIFDTLAYAVYWLDQRDLYYGRKALGALLFFIPRSIWTSKESLIGLDVGGELVGFRMAATDNLSMFFGAEMYADGRLFGVFVFSAAIGYAIGRINYPRSKRLFGHPLHEYLIICSLPILLRGPIGANGSLFVLILPTLSLLLTFSPCRQLSAPFTKSPRTKGQPAIERAGSGSPR